MLPLILSGVAAGGTLMNFLTGSKAKKQASKAYKQYMAGVNRIYDLESLRYKPGGAFERKGLSDIAQARTSSTGAAMSRLIASGMTGGETGTGIEASWEKSVGVPGRLTLEDLRQSRLSEIERERASMLMGQANQAMTMAGEAGRATPGIQELLTQGVNLAGQMWPPKTPTNQSAYQPTYQPGQTFRLPQRGYGFTGLY